MKFSRLTVILLLMLFSPHLVEGQKPFHVSFTTNDYKGFKNNVKTKFKDSTQALTYIKNLRGKALAKGFLTASIDELKFSKNECQVKFYLGEKFGNLFLEVDKKDMDYFGKELRMREKIITKQSFRANEIGLFMQSLHESFLNKGYPFAKVSLIDIRIEDENAKAKLVVERNQRLKWKTINVKGDTAVSQGFISNLLLIKPGDWYDESQLKYISQRIAQIPFLSELKPSELLYTPDGVELFVYLKSKPMSSINGFLGLQPDPILDRYFLTGELSLKLLNILKTGESIEMKWQNVQTQTQQFDARINFPFLFKSPFGIDGQFNLYKRDSTFLQLNGRAAIQYFMKGGNFVSFYYERSSSSLLGGAANNTSFSNLASVSSNNYGVGLTKRNVDYLPNPSRGYSIEVSTSAGQRQTQKTDTSLVDRSLVFKGKSKIEYYLPVAKRHVIRFSNQTNFLSTPDIVQNELFRFGGLTTQRGFNEQEIFASTFTTFSVEYRFLLDRNSRAFLFYDHSFYERNSSGYFNDTPYGFGAGFSFGTAIGIFSIQYALGSQQNNPILFRDGKIHFGYIAYF